VVGGPGCDDEGRAQSAMKNSVYPRGSLFEPKQTGSGSYGDADWPAVGFVHDAGGNYRLTQASKYKGLGTDGKGLGVDMDALNAAMKMSRSPLKALPEGAK